MKSVTGTTITRWAPRLATVLLLAISLPALSWESESSFVRHVREMKAPAARPSRIRSSQMVAMGDGVRLQTSIYLPSSTGRFPTILVRTPYNDATDGVDDAGYSGIADYYVPRGYAVVIQTIRGMYASEGKYRLLSRGEIDDGYAAINWIAGQTWSDGKVAAIGVSHDGYDALDKGNSAYWKARRIRDRLARSAARSGPGGDPTPAMSRSC